MIPDILSMRMFFLVVVLLASIKLFAEDLTLGYPNSQYYQAKNIEIIAKLVSPKSSEPCEECKVFSLENAVENYTLKDKFQLQALQCLINLCPMLLEGETFGEEVLGSHDQKHRHSLIENSDFGKKYRKYLSEKEKLEEDGFEKTRKKILRMINDPKTSKDFLARLHFEIMTIASREAGWPSLLEKTKKQLKDIEKYYKEKPGNMKLEEDEDYLFLLKQVTGLEKLIARGSLYKSEFYSKIVKQKKTAKTAFLGGIVRPKAKVVNEFNRRFVPNLELDKEGRALPLNELVRRFIRYFKDSTNEALAKILDQELSEGLHSGTRKKLLKMKDKLVASGNVVSSDFIEEIVSELSSINMLREYERNHNGPDYKSIKRGLNLFFEDLEADWKDEKNTGLDCLLEFQMRQLETIPTAKQIRYFHEKVYPKELEKVLNFAKENYSDASYKALVDFFNSGVKIMYPKDLEVELDTLNSNYAFYMDEPIVQLFMQKSQVFEANEVEGVSQNCDFDWSPTLIIEDRIDTRPLNLVEVSSASIMSVDRGKEILRHELGHAIYRFFEKNKSKLSKDSRRIMQKHKACTAKNHNYRFFQIQNQFKSEDFADMVSALTSDSKPGNAFCNLAGESIYSKKAQGIFRSNFDPHSPRLYRAIIYEMLKGNEPPQNCLDLYKDAFGGEIKKHSCYPNKVK